MLYSEDKINKGNSVNELPDTTLGQQKSRKAHLKIYKKLQLPILSYPKGQKNPIVKGWAKAEVKELWKEQKKDLQSGNLGLRLEGYMVIDIDDPAIAKEKLGDLEIPVTSVVYRGQRNPENIFKWEERGHIYFKRPAWLNWKGTRKFKELGIELRTGQGSQNAIPDSLHPDGDYYKWYKPEIFKNGIPEFPEELFQKIIDRANVLNEDETVEVKVIAEEEATEEFFGNKAILDQLVSNYGFTCEVGEYTQAGKVISRGLNYFGRCQWASRHTTPGSDKEFVIHLSFTGAIKKHCHHTHCNDIYKEKLTDLFELKIDFSFLDCPDEEPGTEEPAENKTSPNSDIDLLRKRILEIRKKEAKKGSVKNEKIFLAVLNYLNSNGLFLKDSNGNAYFFDKTKKLTIAISEEDKDFISFLHMISLAINEILAKTILNRLKSHCYLAGRAVEIKKFCYYDKKNFCLYLDLRNDKNEILKITTDKITVVDNGMDGIMFLKGRGNPITVNLPLTVTTNKFDEILLNRIPFDSEESNLSVEEQQLLFELFFHAIFFESIFPTKPLLLLYGIKGSGKSYSLRVMGKLLFGDGWDMSSATSKNERDIKVATLHKSFLAIDNADSYLQWLNDFLAKTSTGECFEERKMRTNTEFITIKPACFVGLTARTPSFRRDDIADRLIILKVQPLKNNFIAESTLLEELEEHRDILWAEIINRIQIILRQLQQNKNLYIKTNFRMADFYTFTCKVAGETRIKGIFEKMQQEQFNFSLEEDPLFGILEIFVEKREDEGEENEYLTGKELFDELKIIAESNKLSGHKVIFPKTVRSLGMKLKHLWSGLETKFKCFCDKNTRGHKYLFLRKEEN